MKLNIILHAIHCNAFVRTMHKNDKATESSTETSANNHGIDESLAGDSKTVMNTAKVLNEKIKNHSVEIPWPPKEKDFGSNNVAEYYPELLDVFCTILLSGQTLDRDKSKSNRAVRLKNLPTQDVVYSV